MALVELIEGRKVSKAVKSGSISGERKYYYSGTLAECTSAATTHLGSGWSGSDPYFTMTAEEYEVTQAGDRDDLWFVSFKYHANFWDASAITTVEASASVVLVDFFGPVVLGDFDFFVPVFFFCFCVFLVPCFVAFPGPVCIFPDGL